MMAERFQVWQLYLHQFCITENIEQITNNSLAIIVLYTFTCHKVW